MERSSRHLLIGRMAKPAITGQITAAIMSCQGCAERPGGSPSRRPNGLLGCTYTEAADDRATGHYSSAEHGTDTGEGSEAGAAAVWIDWHGPQHAGRSLRGHFGI